MVIWQEIKSVCPNCGVTDVLYSARNNTLDRVNAAFLALLEIHPGYLAVITGYSLGVAHAAVAATDLRADTSISISLVRKILLT